MNVHSYSESLSDKKLSVFEWLGGAVFGNGLVSALTVALDICRISQLNVYVKTPHNAFHEKRKRKDKCERSPNGSFVGRGGLGAE